jgi:hypothetical protein
VIAATFITQAAAEIAQARTTKTEIETKAETETERETGTAIVTVGMTGTEHAITTARMSEFETERGTAVDAAVAQIANIAAAQPAPPTGVAVHHNILAIPRITAPGEEIAITFLVIAAAAAATETQRK